MVKQLMMFIFLVVFLMNFSSANFACGEVEGRDGYSSVWMDVLIFYDEAPDESLMCTVSGEGKFCCDLEEILSVEWMTGKTVWAEVYDLSSGFVTDRVSLETTEEAYDVFPKIFISRPLSFENPVKEIMVGLNFQSLSVKMHPNYNNLKVFVNSEEKEICEDCSFASFDLEFEKGRNEVRFVASGEREFEINYTIFVLDYLNIEHEFICDKCKVKNEKQYVPANSVVDIKLKVSASHPVEAEILEYIPIDWTQIDDLDIVEFSPSHNFLKFEIDGESLTQTYRLKSPNNLLQKKYEFNTYVGDYYNSNLVYISRLFWFWLPIYFDEDFDNYSFYQTSARQYVGVNAPFIMNLNQTSLNLLAVYPNHDGLFSGILNINEPFLFGSKTECEFLANFGDDEIEKIYLQFKLKEGEMIELTQNEEVIPLEFYRADESFLYYRGHIYTKDKFYIQEV